MNLKPDKKWLVACMFALLTFTACDKARVYEENIMIPDGTWESADRLNFEVAIPRGEQRYSFFLNLRNGPEYPYSNLFVFLTTTYPDGTRSRDTLELTLAGYDGRWLGSGIGSVKFSRFLFEDNILLKQTGMYRFTIEQAMRVNQLKGIRDIGLRIEKADKPG